MRTANVGGRLALAIGDDYIDVAAASGNAFSADPDLAFPRWEELVAWAGGYTVRPEHRLDAALPLGPPVTAPRQIFAIGLNYRAHAQEAGHPIPDAPLVFTKFVTSLTGPVADVALPATTVDYEAELVVVIGRQGHRIDEAQAWSHVAGLTVGQDLSERTLQSAGPAPQFSLGKSYPGFAPIGPFVVTPDEFADPDDLEIGCSIGDAEILQKGRTSDLIFTVAQLIARLSAVCPLLPGDLIFTGTPAGVGAGRTPPRFLQPGETLVTWIEGIGTIRTTLTT